GAVLDAVGSQQTAIFGGLETGPMALLFAAMHPDRVDGLILFNTYARALVADDYPIGITPEYIDARVEVLKAGWGTPEFNRLMFPSRAEDVVPRSSGKDGPVLSHPAHGCGAVGLLPAPHRCA